MVFRDFRFKLLWRVILLTAAISATLYFSMIKGFPVIGGVLAIIVLIIAYELYYFTSQTNRQLSKFLESVTYSDFSTGFSTGNNLGSSFRELNTSFNGILAAIRKARSEKEEHWQYLNTVVEHVSVGVISFDEDGEIGLMNAAAKKLIGSEKLRNIEELIETNSWMYKALFDLPTGKANLFRRGDDLQLSLRATEIKLGETKYKLIALQNIRTELQKKELEAWQNLTRILRHEIMNSIAPIASLTSTLKDILAEDAIRKNSRYEIGEESVEDLEEGLKTIEDRSKGLIRFINAYRDYTTIPPPNLSPVSMEELIQGVLKLEEAEIEKRKVKITTTIDPKDLAIEMDQEQIEQVLINLIKNSLEALEETASPQIKISAVLNEEGLPLISVEDNGQGIIREAMEKIFIPFYTTKTEGSGIGLALSRQILQLHHGTIRVDSEPGEYTRFTLQF